MYVSLYRRYRPQLFSEVIGQTAAIGVITRAIESGNVGHAYLFSGPRGCGKTTVARLFAKAVNCPNRKGAEPCNECDTCRSIVEGSCLDVIEIDGASNNGVDEIRDLKEHVALATFTCPYKVYIIDEVHMLSAGAFNALLKTLEEPPERVIFILATTAPHKVPVTIRSRCQHIPFHGMSSEQIVQRLQQVSKSENIQFEEEALWEIARNSDGGMRDALSLMEQAIAFGSGNVTRDTIEKLLGGGSSSAIRRWISYCHEEPENALPYLESLFRSGAVPERFLSVLFACIRNLWLQSRWGIKGIEALSLSGEERYWIESEKDFFSQQHLERLMSQIASLLPQVRRGLSNDVLCGLLVSWFMETESAVSSTQKKTESDRESEETGAGTVREISENKAVDLRQNIAVNSASAEHENLKPQFSASTETKAAPHEEVRSADIKDPLIPPETEGLVPVSGDVAKKLAENLYRDPQNMMTLRLADILWDNSGGTVSVVFDRNDFIGFESLRSRRGAEAVRMLLKSLNYDAKKVSFYCGSQNEIFEGLDDQSCFQNEPAAKADGKNSQGNANASSAERSTFQSTAVKTSSEPEQGAEQSFKPVPQGGGESLSDYLRSFMDGELLFCRPNEKTEDNDEDTEN